MVIATILDSGKTQPYLPKSQLSKDSIIQNVSAKAALYQKAGYCKNF
jgi:hypothetical protein